MEINAVQKVDGSVDGRQSDAHEHLYKGRLWRVDGRSQTTHEEKCVLDILTAPESKKSAPLKRDACKQAIPAFPSSGVLGFMQLGGHRDIPLLTHLRGATNLLCSDDPAALSHCSRILIVVHGSLDDPELLKSRISHFRSQGQEVITLHLDSDRTRLAFWQSTTVLTYEDLPSTPSALTTLILGS